MNGMPSAMTTTTPITAIVVIMVPPGPVHFGMSLRNVPHGPAILQIRTLPRPTAGSRAELETRCFRAEVVLSAIDQSRKVIPMALNNHQRAGAVTVRQVTTLGKRQRTRALAMARVLHKATRGSMMESRPRLR